MNSPLPIGPLPNSSWTVQVPGTPQGGRPTSKVVCSCGTRRELQNRFLVGATARSRSCGCQRGAHVSQTAQERMDGGWCPAPLPPNGFAVALSGSVRGEKWAASGPETADPWYVGPCEERVALRFATRAQAREWIGRRRVSVRGPGEYTVVPMAFSDQAPRWLPGPLVQAMATLDSRRT